MFDIGWGELLLIAVVALIAIGPKELPGALRTLGQWMAKIRRMASEFQNQFQDAMREAEMAELRKEVDDMAAQASKFTQFDPIEDVRKDIERSVGDLPSLDGPVTGTPAATTTETPAAPAAIEAMPGSDSPPPPPPEPAAMNEPALPMPEKETAEAVGGTQPEAGARPA